MREERPDDFRRVALFDVVANNADRKSGHCLLSTEGRVFAIDHGVCFHSEPKLRTVIWDFAGEEVPTEMAEDLRRLADELERGELRDELADVLPPVELGARAATTRRALGRGPVPRARAWAAVPVADRLSRISRREPAGRSPRVDAVPPFSSFLEEHRAGVYRFLLAAVGPQNADDCFQETFLSALRAYADLRDARNLRGWVLTIATRKALDHWRARERRPLPVEELPERPAPPREEADPELWRAVGALPPMQRAAVIHRYVLARTRTAPTARPRESRARPRSDGTR